MADSPLDPTGAPPGDDPGELLRAFRWTQVLARRLTRDPALAADLHQETWTRALERFEGTTPARSWLVGTLRSLAFRTRRSRDRRWLHESRAARPDDAEPTAQVIERSEAQRAVAAAVARLPEHLRVAVLLHFQEGLSLAEVARHLGCSKSTAGERVQRGLAMLRKELRADDSSWRSCCLLALPLGTALGPLVPSIPIGAGLSAASAGPLLPSTLFGVAVKKVALAGAVTLALLLVLLTSTSTGRQGPDDPQPAHRAPADLVADEDPERAETTAALDPVAPEPERLEVVAPPSPAANRYVLVAKVIDQDDASIPRPRLVARARDWHKEALGDGTGTVSLSLDAADIAALTNLGLTVEVIGPRYQTMWSTYISHDGTSRRARPMLGEVEDLGTIQLLPAGAVEGRAYSSTGDPIAGAELQVYGYDPEDPDENWHYEGVEPRVFTDERGWFEVPHLLPGMVSIGLTHADFLRESTTATARIHVGETVGPITLSATPAAIVTGQVVDTDGAPLEGTYVNGTGNWTITETDLADESGNFRIALRAGSPAMIKAYRPGWRQIEPPPETLHGGGEIRIVLMAELPAAEHRVLVVDAESSERVHQVGLTVLEGDAPTDHVPDPVTQPAEGLPVDYVPGEVELLISAPGYEPRIVGTGAHRDGPPHLTVELHPSGGVRGRLLENGRPVVGARVQVSPLWAHVARPRESLRAGKVRRHAQAEVDVRALTGNGGYVPESVLGLDGAPPGYRLNASAPKRGTRTDDEGRFRFPVLEDRALGLMVKVEGRPQRVLGTHVLERGSLDLGDVELRPAATLTGRFRCGPEWDPTRHALVVRQPRREVQLDAQGRFRIEGLEPGPTYFTLGLAGVDDLFAELGLSFKGVPEFHVDLAPGEERTLTVDLDSYLSAHIDLTVTVGGAPPNRNARIHATLVDQPERVFRVGDPFQGSRLQATTRALGPCHLSLSMSGTGGGWVELALPGPPHDLSAGEISTRTVDVPAGHLRIQLPAGPSAAKFDLALEGMGAPIELRGLAPTSEGSLLAGPFPPGNYFATLSTSTDDPEGNATVASFEAEVRTGETEVVDL